jgi:hypothetical protein
VTVLVQHSLCAFGRRWLRPIFGNAEEQRIAAHPDEG